MVASRALAAVRELKDPRARPNAGWVSSLTGVPVPRVERIMNEAGGFLPVEAEIRRRHVAGGRTHYAQFRAPLELYALTRILRPHHIVETGVSSGVSSAHFLLALRRNGRGRLHSIDLPTPQRGTVFGPNETPVALPPGRSSGWAIPDSLRRGWDLILGPSQTVLPELVGRLDVIDLFLHDSLHTPRHLAFELATVRPRLRPGSAVLADNTVWTGRAFDRFAAQVGAPVRRRGRSDLVGLSYPGDPASPRRAARGQGSR